MPASAKPSYFRYWILGVIVAMSFLLGDAAAVAVPAMAISPAHLIAFLAAFALIAAGALFTVWKLKS